MLSLINLPQKSRKDGWPKFLFVCPSLHTNYRNNAFRKKFSRVLEDVCVCTVFFNWLIVSNSAPRDRVRAPEYRVNKSVQLLNFIVMNNPDKRQTILISK